MSKEETLASQVNELRRAISATLDIIPPSTEGGRECAQQLGIAIANMESTLRNEFGIDVGIPDNWMEDTRSE